MDFVKTCNLQIFHYVFGNDVDFKDINITIFNHFSNTFLCAIAFQNLDLYSQEVNRCIQAFA
jgi:hypothetical protein